ncbi:ABC transporter permease [Roseateles cellulosilyticus]|uniref:FtsX-like permease family protein n=1 Tax=Pelomonas cellulosilytica TaxID=2906762 RepID=A0ABS8XRE1_9BURK|nr:FtsX-like permease family protein [Pelomonas sp. P8]MCE4555287.1 FtsX-like permease family protein [Pelomonas sp. P8]
MSLWRHLTWPTWRDHPSRVLLAILAVTLGVALAFGVHLLNGAALTEFARAARSVNGQPDLVLRARSGPLTDADFADILTRPEVAAANPIVEAQALWPGHTGRDGRAQTIRLIGLDPLALLASAQAGKPLAPELTPQLDGNDPVALLGAQTVHLNAAARSLLPADAKTLTLRIAPPGAEPRDIELTIGGRIAAGTAPLGVLDIADAQQMFGRLGALDRIDLQLTSGIDANDWAARLPERWRAAPPEDEGARLSDLTRAYRVNLGLLALMALFTGSFLVYAVLSLATAQRLPQWALVGVLGVSARMRWRLILVEGLLLGAIGTALGLALGVGLAAGALTLLGSDLGLHGASGSSAELLFNQPLLVPALVYGLLGLAAAVVAALAPALTVRRIAPALVLKGLGLPAGRALPAWAGLALMALGAVLAALPPVWGDTPVAAYASMFCLLIGGLALVPALVRGMTAALSRLPGPSLEGPLLLLARERSRDQATEARRSLAGVLVALALAVAMTVMIGSFRESLTRWLDQALPADLYVRSALRGADGLPAPLAPALIDQLRRQTAFARASPQRTTRLRLAPGADPVALTARELDTGTLPLMERWTGATAADAVGVWVNEAARDRDGLAPGRVFDAALADGGRVVRLQVRGVWRDYSRQSTALWMALPDYRRLSGDSTSTELGLWLAPGQALDAARDAVRRLGGSDVETAAAGELRAMSLQIFDRSFTITLWLQAVALAVGLFGVIASQSAQALSRRREFGLLRHLGLSRRALMKLLLLEASLTGGAGALAGLALGLALSVVLVYVVNPQSFHWTMELSLPVARLSALVGLAFAAAVGASLLAGRRALGTDAVRAVREDA